MASHHLLFGNCDWLICLNFRSAGRTWRGVQHNSGALRAQAKSGFYKVQTTPTFRQQLLLLPMLRSAKKALDDGAYEEVLRISGQVLQQNKDSYDAYVLVGTAAMHLGFFDKAEAAFGRAKELCPDVILAHQGAL